MSVTMKSLFICTLQRPVRGGGGRPRPLTVPLSLRRQLAVGHRDVDAHALAALLPEQVPEDAQDPRDDDEQQGAGGEALEALGRVGQEEEEVRQDAQVDEVDDGADRDHRDAGEPPRLVRRRVPHALGALDVGEEQGGDGRDAEHREDLERRDRQPLHRLVLPEDVHGDHDLAEDEAQDVVLHRAGEARVDVREPLGAHAVHAPGEDDAREGQVRQRDPPQVERQERQHRDEQDDLVLVHHGEQAEEVGAPRHGVGAAEVAAGVVDELRAPRRS